MIDIILETGNNRRETVRRAVQNLGDDLIERARNAEYIFIKVNLVDSEWPLACTHIDAVRGLLDVLRSRANTPIVIADGSYRGTIDAFYNLGYEMLKNEYSDIELLDLNDAEFVDDYFHSPTEEKVHIRRAKLATKSGGLKISLTPLKTDINTTASLSIQNWAMGTWVVPSRISATGRVWARWPWLASDVNAYHYAIADLFAHHKFNLAIIDGIEAMEGEGPVRGEKMDFGAVLAGFDPVSVDAAAVSLMGFDPEDIGYLRRLRDLNFGIIDMAKINVPPMLFSQLARKFKTSNNN
ncbi:DUF362 domain-containing protein [Candidatus Parcubacteria bacterium]|nr:MAG: DUF362 domain-containing protein [Candidatus Parcubacteria bacterium]